MNIQLASDLHLEMLQKSWPRERLVEPAPLADVLVLAGDIHNGTRAIELFADWPVPVLYLAGNHEFYHETWQDLRAELRRVAAGTCVRFLDNDAVELGGVRFLASTLWTDYAVTGAELSEAMVAAEDFVLDHQRIHLGTGFFLPEHALQEHQRCRLWLRDQLARPHQGPTVVITHHGPHPKSIHPRFEDSPVNGAFVSDLADLVHQADVWLHGHVHDSFDYRVGRCRVVTNPRGYAQNRKLAGSVEQLQFENPEYRRDFVVEVPT